MSLSRHGNQQFWREKAGAGISFSFSFFFFLLLKFLFSFICDFGSQKEESIPEDGSTDSPNLAAVLTESGVDAFWPDRGILSLFPSFCRHSCGCFCCPGQRFAIWFVFPVSGDYLWDIFFFPQGTGRILTWRNWLFLAVLKRNSCPRIVVISEWKWSFS